MTMNKHLAATRVCDLTDRVSWYLLFGGVLSHHVAEVLLLHLGLLLSDVLLVLLGHGHRVQLQLLGGQRHLHAVRLLSSAGLASSHGLKERKEGVRSASELLLSQAGGWGGGASYRRHVVDVG